VLYTKEPRCYKADGSWPPRVKSSTGIIAPHRASPAFRNSAFCTKERDDCPKALHLSRTIVSQQSFRLTKTWGRREQGIIAKHKNFTQRSREGNDAIARCRLILHEYSGIFGVIGFRKSHSAFPSNRTIGQKSARTPTAGALDKDT